jgi:3-phenylpropionate/trans-cinnamate dioxygenase ferredoxin reductase subunit
MGQATGVPRTIAIAGASLAGASAAIALRDEGYDGRIVLVGAEAELPYERPPLSKKYLSGEQPFEKALVRPATVYEEREIELVLGTPVASVDARERALVLDDDRRIRADRLLVTTGGRNRRPPIPGLDLPGVYDLRTRADSDAVRAQLRPGLRAVVVGMGFVGSEVAATLRTAGADVVAIEAFSVPLERVLGPVVGGAIASLHHDSGVELVLGDGVASFEGDGRVRRVRTVSGRTVDCELVVVGLGIEPNVELVEGTGVAVDDGIVVDELCRTSVEGIYAAGDVARHAHPVFGTHVRVEHWLNAIEQGGAAARSMLGNGAPYAELHWFWSDQYDANLQYAGHHRDWDELVVRGSLEERRFVAFYVKDGVPHAGVALNMGRDLRRSFALLRARRPVDPELLRDPDVDLRTIPSPADADA